MRTGNTAGYEDLIRIECGRCGKSFPLLEWRATPVSGELPPDTYQCPGCRNAFRRQRTGKRAPWPEIELVVVPSWL